MTKKRVLLGTLIAATIAVLFPPWGFMGEDFDHFAFAFSGEEMLWDYPNLRARIVWHVLGLELVAIALLGAIAYVLAPPSKTEKP